MAHPAGSYTVEELYAGLECACARGEVVKRTDGELVLYNYKDIVHANWDDPFVCMARGIVLRVVNEEAKQIVALPFPKFFNYNERPPEDGFPEIESVQEKFDGSLGIAFMDPKEGDWRVNTRGSFTSPQAVWATRRLRQYMEDTGMVLPPSKTFLFEIICDDSRQIVAYEESHLRGLAAYDTMTCQEMGLDWLREALAPLNIPMAEPCAMESVEDIIQTLGDLPGNEKEGFVVKFIGGERRKFKGTQYILMHRLRGDYSKKRVWGIMKEFPDAEQAKQEALSYFETLPEEHYPQLCAWAAELHEDYSRLCAQMMHDVEATSHLESPDLGRAISGKLEPAIDFQLPRALRKNLFVYRKVGEQQAFKNLWKTCE